MTAMFRRDARAANRNVTKRRHADANLLPGVTGPGGYLWWMAVGRWWTADPARSL